MIREVFFVCFWQFSPLFMSKSESLLSLFAQLLFLKSKGNNLLSALFKKEQLRANRSPRSLQKSHREKFAIVAYYNRATGAIHSFSRANRSFAHKKRGIHTKNRWANSQPCERVICSFLVGFASNLFSHHAFPIFMPKTEERIALHCSSCSL